MSLPWQGSPWPSAGFVCPGLPELQMGWGEWLLNAGIVCGHPASPGGTGRGCWPCPPLLLLWVPSAPESQALPGGTELLCRPQPCCPSVPDGPLAGTCPLAAHPPRAGGRIHLKGTGSCSDGVAPSSSFAICTAAMWVRERSVGYPHSSRALVLLPRGRGMEPLGECAACQL